MLNPKDQTYWKASMPASGIGDAGGGAHAASDIEPYR